MIPGGESFLLLGEGGPTKGNPQILTGLGARMYTCEPTRYLEPNSTVGIYNVTSKYAGGFRAIVALIVSATSLCVCDIMKS